MSVFERVIITAMEGMTDELCDAMNNYNMEPK